MATGLKGWHNAPHPFLSMVFLKKIIGMFEFLLRNEGVIGIDEAELLNCALIDKFIMIVGLRRFFIGLAIFRAHFSLFA